jgi:hypothetical protein
VVVNFYAPCAFRAAGLLVWQQGSAWWNASRALCLRLCLPPDHACAPPGTHQPPLRLRMLRPIPVRLAGCSWCKKLEPTWDAASKTVHDKHPESTDGRIRFARVRAGFCAHRRQQQHQQQQPQQQQQLP